MNKKPFISICILSYNRPETLLRLLETIDTSRSDEIEVVICEDCSPRQQEIRDVVKLFDKKQPFPVLYYENEKNIGYDGTFSEVTRRANGEWIIYMGDDDEFVPEALDKMMFFLAEHSELGYVMKSHYTVYNKNKKEPFRYYNKTNIT